MEHYRAVNLDIDKSNTSDKMRERKYDLDVMRIISTLGVIGIHVSSGVLEQLCTFAVPLFVMISGVLWLDEQVTVSVEKIWKKNIFRIVTAFLFWSLVYILYEAADEMNVRTFVYQWLTGYYHMWFCYMIVGVYMFIPVIRKLKEDRKLYVYLLLLSGVIAVIIPSALKIPSIAAFEYNADLLFYKMGVGFVFYFMLGDFLHRLKLKSIYRKLLYIGGILSFAVMCTGMWKVDDFDIFKVIYVSSIFVAVRELMSRIKIKSKICYFLQQVSGLCFGIYMIHVLILKLVNRFFSLNTILPDILIIGIVFMISLGIAYIINKLPCIRKYII